MQSDRQGDDLPQRSRMAASSTFTYSVESNWAVEWLDSLPYYNDLDDYREVSGGRHVAWMRPETDPLEWTPTDTHRSGTCFDVESTEMRAACVDTIQEYIGADDVLHEVRHQRSGYHTDLVYADVSAEKVRERIQLVIGDDPIHDPLQRFRVWYYIKEYGPMTRSKAEENGRYSDPSKNRKHLNWLLEHGYLAQTNAGAVTAVTPPSICELHAVELKRRDWETALEQAERARRHDCPDWRSQNWKDRYGYADYAWVALDAGAIGNALDNAERFREEGVGLLAVTEGGAVVEHIEADHRPRGLMTRDRAYAESQIWSRLDHDEWAEETHDEQPEPKQKTLVTDGGTEQHTDDDPHLGGADRVPDRRMGGQGQPVGEDKCRECGADLGAGYICDDCDTVEVVSA